MAVSKGYRILEIHEVYEYAVTQYDASTGEGGLFVEYIDTFLKLKAEASGYPSWVRNRADEDRYIEEFRQTRESCSIKTRSGITPPNEHSPNSV